MPYGAAQTVLGKRTAARLPFDPTAEIVPPEHMARPNRTEKRPPASAVTALRRWPSERTTRSRGLKPRPATCNGFIFVRVSFGRADWGAGAAGLSSAASRPNVISSTIRPIASTTAEV